MRRFERVIRQWLRCPAASPPPPIFLKAAWRSSVLVILSNVSKKTAPRGALNAARTPGPKAKAGGSISEMLKIMLSALELVHDGY